MTRGGVDAVGDEVNTAARLESAAPLYACWWTGGQSGNGAGHPLPAGGAGEAKGKHSRSQREGRYAPRSIAPEQARVSGLPLVGRDAEANPTRDALDRSRRESSTQLVLIIGQPGIGKTRLVKELVGYVEELPELITWRRGRSLAYGEGAGCGHSARWSASRRLGVGHSTGSSHELAEAVAALIMDGRDRTGWCGNYTP